MTAEHILPPTAIPSAYGPEIIAQVEREGRHAFEAGKPLDAYDYGWLQAHAEASRRVK